MDFERAISEEKKQIRKWLWLGIGIAFVTTGAAALTVSLRLKVLTIAIASVGWIAGLFLYEMKAGPLRTYRQFLILMRDGARRQASGEVLSLSGKRVEISGLQFWELRIREERDESKTTFLQEETHERLLYADAARPKPKLKPGQRIRVTLYDNVLVSIDSLEGRETDG